MQLSKAGTETNMELWARGLSKVYQNNLEVIKQASLNVRGGEFIMIIGPSGSGKSTLLYLLSGIRRPTSGEVFWNDIPLSELSQKELAHLRYEKFSFIFQQHLLVPYLNVWENVCLARGVGLKKHAEYLLASLGLKGHLYKRPNELSYGERQRVAVARGLIHNPKLLFADEPTASVNPELAQTIARFLAQYCRSGGACVMVTHDVSLLPMATRTFTLKDGVLTESDFIGD
ncbi:MAG: ABC transporter ATP-binding protein [Firmicutes bacterium]|nr:ABC transporter ATP-binding protein [Bacillota bacterium]